MTTNSTPNVTAAWMDLEASVRAVLETYANVHRGSGHFSIVTSSLFEKAREIVLNFVDLDETRHEVVFCTLQRAEVLESQLGAKVLRRLSSEDIGLPLGVRALVTTKGVLRNATAPETGGGTARLVSRTWVIWSKGSARFEAGTPAIVNVIAFARALQLLQKYAIAAFEPMPSGTESASTGALDPLASLSGLELLGRLKHLHVGADVQVPTSYGMQPFVNLDNAASTPTFAPILDSFCNALKLPASARAAIVQDAKSTCAVALGASLTDYDVIFTSNTTEAINLVAQSIAQEPTPGVDPVIVNTLLEHNSNELPWRMVPGHSLIRLEANDEGVIDLAQLENLLREYNREKKHGQQRIRLLAMTGASNVLGTFNDLAEVSRVTHEYGARLLVDGAQWVAHRGVEMHALGIDYLAFSGHKMYAPFGSGALVARKGLLRWTNQRWKAIESSGTANAAGIAALSRAFSLLMQVGMDVVQREEQALTAHALERLSAVRGIRVFGIKSSASVHFARKGGVIPFMLEQSMPKKTAELLAELGAVGVRYGCHCSHLLVKRLHRIPPILEYVQRLFVSLFPKIELPGVVRVSLGIENTVQHVDALVATLTDVAARKANRVPAFRKRLLEFVQSVTERVYG